MNNFIEEVMSWAALSKKASYSVRNKEINEAAANIILLYERSEPDDIEHFIHEVVAQEQIDNPDYEDFRSIAEWFEIELDDCLIAELVDEMYADDNSITEDYD